MQDNKFKTHYDPSFITIELLSLLQKVRLLGILPISTTRKKSDF